MARPSRWMQFTQNFNAMNSTMNDAFKKYETGKASKSEDYFSDELDEEGNKVRLTGNDLKFAKNNAIADIYDKYGDQEGAMKLRTGNEELQGLMRNNRIGKATEADQIYIQGKGGRNKLDAGIAASNSAAGASVAAARASDLQSEALELTARNRETMNNVITGMGSMEFESKADEDAYLISELSRADLPPAMRNEALTAVRTFGAEGLALESDRLINGAKKEMRGGLSSFQGWYNDEIADGANIEYETADGVTTAYSVVGEGDDAKRNVIATGKGDDSENQVLVQLFQNVQDPSQIMGAAADNLAYQQARANLKKTGSETNRIDSEVDVNEAQIDRIESGIKVDEAQIGRIASQNSVDAAQIGQIQANIGLTDARALQVAAETVLTQGLKTDQLKAQIADIKAQTAGRGISSQLDEAQMVHLAAKTAQINFNMDPERPMTRVEVTREWADFTAKMALQGYSPEEIKPMEGYFYDSILKDRTGQFTVRPVE